MGSVDNSDSEQEIQVLITGFGPFKKDYPINPSWEIANSLPKYLPPLRPKDPNRQQWAKPLPPVRLLVYREPIRVSFDTVRDLVPVLWDLDGLSGQKSPDFVIHIGMAGPQLKYSIERRGHRDGYMLKDVDGKLLGDEERKEKEGEDWIWDGCPPELCTMLNMEDVLWRWKHFCPDGLDLRISEDAGHYLCDFIYYSSLAHLCKAGQQHRVLFLHVPCDASMKNILVGIEVVLQLVRAVVESEQEKPAPKEDVL